MVAVRIVFILATYVGCFSFRHSGNYLHRSEAMMNRNVAKLINSYIKPLSEKFPNHELEIQVDIQGPPIHHIGPKALRRKGPLQTKSPKTPQPAKESKQSQDGKAAMKQSLSDTSTILPASPTIKAHTEKHAKKEHTKESVSKDELKKALDDLEKKLSKSLLRGPVSNPEPQLVVSNPGPVSGGSNQNINRILELIKRGVHFQKHVPNTDDGNMEWLQIKIPKTLAIDKKIT